jgi:hypothetical protein
MCEFRQQGVSASSKCHQIHAFFTMCFFTIYVPYFTPQNNNNYMLNLHCRHISFNFVSKEKLKQVNQHKCVEKEYTYSGCSQSSLQINMQQYPSTLLPNPLQTRPELHRTLPNIIPGHLYRFLGSSRRCPRNSLGIW